jgi:peroxiredoxin
MTRFALLAVSLVALASLGPAGAGTYNKKLSVGDAAPAWSGLPGTDGKKHALADLMDKKAVVLVFTCNSCPVAASYEDRIIAFAKKHAADVAVVAVNVNTVEADRLDKMAERAKEKGFQFAYLYDESQQIARDYGANFTPEFFVLDRERKVAYLGAIDDKNKPEDVKLHYLEDAVTALLKGEKPKPAETQARGCQIRFARAKR